MLTHHKLKYSSGQREGEFHSCNPTLFLRLKITLTGQRSVFLDTLPVFGF